MATRAAAAGVVADDGINVEDAVAEAATAAAIDLETPMTTKLGKARCQMMMMMMDSEK